MNRRGFITGLTSLVVAAPAIVRVSSLMPVKAFDPIHAQAWGDFITITGYDQYGNRIHEITDNVVSHQHAKVVNLLDRWPTVSTIKIDGPVTRTVWRRARPSALG